MTDERWLADLIGSLAWVDREGYDRAWARLDRLTKPPRSLGALERLAARLAAIQGTTRPSAEPAAIVVMAGDHGVADQGVSAYPREVTVQMVANFAHGGAAINQLAAHAGADLVVVDVGCAQDTTALPGVRQAKVRSGTGDITLGPAMTREECLKAIRAGADIARELASTGVRIVGVGEMGIGNTTAAGAVVAALAGVHPSLVAWRGTGLDDEGVARKVSVIERALAVNDVRAEDPIGVLAGVGGLEIAGIVGVMLGCAQTRTPCVVDGFITGAAALAACALAPAVSDHLVQSHLSAERGHRVVIDAIGLEPMLRLDMRLGEGSGAALAISLARAACAVMNGMATFDEAGVSEAVQ